MRHRPIDRRTLLRGAGAGLALPWLEVMAPRRGPLAPLPTRLVCLFAPNGMLPSGWTPAEEGPDWAPTRTLAPLDRHRARALILSGLRNRNSLAGEGHYVKTTALLSGAPVHKTGGRDLRVGTTIDQLLARERGHETRLPSLVLGVEGVRHAVDMGYSTVYGAHISWRTPTQPATKEVDPRRVFDRLFRTSKRHPGDAAVLDLVAQETGALRKRLGGADQGKLDEYLEAVRDLERRLERFERSLDVERPAFPEDFGPHQERARWMLDLIALAIETDATRVASLMFGNAVSNLNFSFLDGVEGGHHTLSHHENDPGRMDQYQRINRWHVEQLASLLDRLEAKTEGDGSLLDRTLVFFGSGLRDGNRHDPNDLPIVVAGGQGAGLASGAHLRFPMHTKLCHLYVSLLNAAGVPTASFGDAEGELAGVRVR